MLFEPSNDASKTATIQQQKLDKTYNKIPIVQAQVVDVPKQTTIRQNATVQELSVEWTDEKGHRVEQVSVEEESRRERWQTVEQAYLEKHRIDDFNDAPPPPKSKDAKGVYVTDAHFVRSTMFTAGKLAKLTQEFPEAFPDPNTPQIAGKTDPNAPIKVSEDKLRRFLLQDQQKSRPFAKENPTSSNTPLASRKYLSSPTQSTVKSPHNRTKIGQAIRVSHALQDAEAYKASTDQLWQEYWVMRPASSSGWAGLVEERIERARQEGVFTDLPGRGEKLKYIEEDPDHNNPFLDKTEYFLNKSIKSQGLKPMFVGESKELEDEIQLVRVEMKKLFIEFGNDKKVYQSKAEIIFKERITEINRRIRNYNMTCPAGIPEKFPLSMQREIDRGAGLQRVDVQFSGRSMIGAGYLGAHYGRIKRKDDLGIERNTIELEQNTVELVADERMRIL